MSPKSFLLMSSSTLLILLKFRTSTPLRFSSLRIAFQMLSIRLSCSLVMRSTSWMVSSAIIPETGSLLSGVRMARCVRMPMRTR